MIEVVIDPDLPKSTLGPWGLGSAVKDGCLHLSMEFCQQLARTCVRQEFFPVRREESAEYD